MSDGEKIGKKRWQKPELIVLVRSKPEEAVLWACKDISSPGAQNTAGGCGIPPTGWCSQCDASAGS